MTPGNRGRRVCGRDKIDKFGRGAESPKATGALLLEPLALFEDEDVEEGEEEDDEPPPLSSLGSEGISTICGREEFSPLSVPPLYPSLESLSSTLFSLPLLSFLSSSFCPPQKKDLPRIAERGPERIILLRRSDREAEERSIWNEEA